MYDSHSCLKSFDTLNPFQFEMRLCFVDLSLTTKPGAPDIHSSQHGGAECILAGQIKGI